VSRLREGSDIKASSQRPVLLDSRSAIDLTIILAVAAIGYIIRLDKLGGYSCEDDAAYVAACGLILRGYLPHRDFFLAHPPTFFFFIATVWRLLGLENPQTMWFTGKIFSFLSFVASGLVIYLICRDILKNRLAGLIGIGIYQLSSQSYLFSTSCAPQLPATLLILSSVYLLLRTERKTRTRMFIIGLILGISLTTRLSTLYVLPTFLFYELTEEERHWRTLLYGLVGLLIPIAAILLTASVHRLWYDLVVFHLLKGGATWTEKMEKFLSILFNRELPHLLGIVSTPYILAKGDRRHSFLLGQGIFMFGPYFMQATPGAHLVIESSPFFTIVAAIAIHETGEIVLNRRRSLATIGVSLLLLSTLALSLPGAISEIRAVQQETPLEGRIYGRLVEIVERETREEDYVFSQIPVVPFLAGREYPPFIDTSQSAKNAGIYTPEVVADLVLRYRVKLLIVWYRTGEELSGFLKEQGFSRVERLGGYWIYLR